MPICLAHETLLISERGGTWKSAGLQIFSTSLLISHAAISSEQSLVHFARPEEQTASVYLILQVYSIPRAYNSKLKLIVVTLGYIIYSINQFIKFLGNWNSRDI